jgi:hypothetical protein
MKCYIYRIQDNNNIDSFYIGSTVNLSRRKSHHKKNVKNKVGKLYWCKLYLYIRNNGGWDNFTFEKIHEIESDNNTDIKNEEQAIINILKPTLNTNKSCCSLTCITTYKEKNI